MAASRTLLVSSLERAGKPAAKLSMTEQVHSRGFKQRRVITKVTKPRIAAGAEQSAYAPGLMAMVYCQPFSAWRLAAYGAQPALERKHFVVSLNVKFVYVRQHPSVSVVALLLCLSGTPPCFAPFSAASFRMEICRLLFNATRAAEMIKAVWSAYALMKIACWLNELAKRASFLAGYVTSIATGPMPISLCYAQVVGSFVRLVSLALSVFACARLAMNIQAVFLAPVAAKVQSTLTRLALGADFFGYNGFSHGVNLRQGLRYGKTRSGGSNLSFGSLSILPLFEFFGAYLLPCNG